MMPLAKPDAAVRAGSGTTWSQAALAVLPSLRAATLYGSPLAAICARTDFLRARSLVTAHPSGKGPTHPARRLERHHHGGHDQDDRIAATEVIIYEPFTRWGTVAAGIDAVARSSNADCYSGAISSPRRDTFRCITKQNLLYDPCFLDLAGPLRLACWRGPHPSQVVIVTPERPFPSYATTGPPTSRAVFPG